MKLIGYGRASTIDQKYTQDLQLNKIKEYCQLYGHELVEFYYDQGISGKSIDRPEFQRAVIELTSGGAEGIIVYKLDRLTRNLGDLNRLIDQYFAEDYSLISVCDHLDTKTPSGRLVLNILGSVAQWELETIQERTKAALSVAKAQGKRLGRPPYGYKVVDSFMVEDESQQPILSLMIEMRKARKSFDAIAQYLNAEGVPSRKGGLWYASTIKLILDNNDVAPLTYVRGM